MIDVVKESFDVNIYHPRITPAICAGLLDGLVRTLSRTITKRVWREVFISPLTQKYGWGIHFDNESKIAMYPMESEEYERLAKRQDLKVVKAMKTKK